MENLELPFNDILTQLVSKTKLDDFVSSCQHENPLIIDAAKEISTLVNDSNLPDDKQSILNYITGKYLLSLHEKYVNTILNKEKKDIDDEEDDDDEIDDNEAIDRLEQINKINDFNLRNIFTIIDLSIHIDENYSDYNCFAMHTFVIIISYLFPINFIIENFSPIFFDNKCKDRLLLLTKGNKLQGKVKPGSRLLVIYKQIVNKIPTFEYGNEEIIAKFRHFILNSLEISDKLTQSSDWHMSNKSINGYYSSFESFYNIKKINLVAPTTFKNKNNPRNLFNEYISLMKFLTTSTESELIQSINKGFNTSSSNINNNSSQLKLWYIDNINRSLNSIQQFDHRKLIKIPLNNKNDKQFKWILDEDNFNQQLKTFDFYYSIKIQMIILINFFNEITVDKWKKDSEIIHKEYSKFRKPEPLTNPITSVEAKRKISDWYIYSINGFKQKNFHYNEIKDLLEKNEKTFTKMKLKNFSHPEIEQINQNLESKKRKLEDYISESNDLEKSITNKRPKFIHKMGTPKITKLWEAEKISEWKDGNDILESVKDDIYFARGKYEENPKDEENSETYKRLCWKGLRSIKESGNWLQLSKTNEEGKLDNEDYLF